MSCSGYSNCLDCLSGPATASANTSLLGNYNNRLKLQQNFADLMTKLINNNNLISFDESKQLIDQFIGDNSFAKNWITERNINQIADIGSIDRSNEKFIKLKKYIIANYSFD